MVGSTGSIGWPTSDQLVYRREVVLMASLVGAALACSGVVYQAILQNPLADPYLLGISSGASLAAYLWRFTAIGGIAAGLSQQAFAFGGALLAIAVVFALAGVRRGARLEPLTLLLVGVIVNAVNASIYLLLNAITRDLPGSGGPYLFLVGGLQTNLEPSQKLAAAVVVGLGWLILLSISGQLNVATLSEGEALSLGVRIHRLRWLALIVASLVTASAVAVSGPIGFVGLVCPHLARLVVGHDHRRLVPVATALGAGLLAVADAVSRKLAGMENVLLPVGVLTGLLGGPFFLLLLWRKRQSH
jgi:iron complex transport system permease protein